MDFLIESPRSNTLKASLLSSFTRLNHFQKAILVTLICHALLLLMLPPLPTFIFSGLDQRQGLIVTLLKEPEEPVFNPSLNQQLPLAADVEQVASPSLGAQSIDRADDTLVSDQQELTDLNGNENSQRTIKGNLASQQDTPSVRFDFAAIKAFAKKDAFKVADSQPRKIERFARTFNRSRSVYRRSRSDSYRNQIGDIYARSNSSTGDICFKQQKDNSQTELITNTVYFFRCDSKPLGFDLNKNSNLKASKKESNKLKG